MPVRSTRTDAGKRRLLGAADGLAWPGVHLPGVQMPPDAERPRWCQPDPLIQPRAPAPGGRWFMLRRKASELAVRPCCVYVRDRKI